MLRAGIARAAFPARRIGILVPNPYLAAFKAARAFFTNRAGISASALRRMKRIIQEERGT